MSILIKGMEMPTTCRDCRLLTFTDFDSMPFCNITMNDICLNDWETKRCDNCPLVPAPPHGRLIDADAMCDWLVPNHPVVIYAGCMPTIIPAEEGE